MLAKNLGLAEIGVQLWLGGYSVEESNLRRWLEDRLAWFRKFRSEVERVGPSGIGEKVVKNLLRAPTSQKERFGAADPGPERYDLAYDGMSQVAASIADASVPLGADGVDLLLTNYNLPQAELDRASSLDLDIEHEMHRSMETIAAFETLVSKASLDEIEIARRMAMVLSTYTAALRNQPASENSELAKLIITQNEAAPFFGSAGVIWSLAAIRRVSGEIGPEALQQKVLEAEGLFGGRTSQESLP
jgi:hypothetical protein